MQPWELDKLKSRVAGEAARDLDDPGGLALDVAGLDARVASSFVVLVAGSTWTCCTSATYAWPAAELLGVSHSIHELGRGGILVIISLCWTTQSFVACVGHGGNAMRD